MGIRMRFRSKRRLRHESGVIYKEIPVKLKQGFLEGFISVLNKTDCLHMHGRILYRVDW